MGGLQIIRNKQKDLEHCMKMLMQANIKVMLMSKKEMVIATRITEVDRNYIRVDVADHNYKIQFDKITDFRIGVKN